MKADLGINSHGFVECRRNRLGLNELLKGTIRFQDSLNNERKDAPKKS